MKRDKPPLARSELRSEAVLRLYPRPVLYAEKHLGTYSFAGAYLMSRGLREDAAGDDSVRFPQPGTVSDQLMKDNPLLRRLARGLVAGHEDDQQVLVADVFAETLLLAEDEADLRLAMNLLDAALFLSRADAFPGTHPFRLLERTEADLKRETP